MAPGARTPEELETLFEDAFVIRDPVAVAELFEEDALLVVDHEEARGRNRIERLAADTWERAAIYVADAHRILQAHDTALIMGDAATNVMRRGMDRKWRYAISLLRLDHQLRWKAGQDKEGAER